MPKITIENLAVTIDSQPGRNLLNSLLYDDLPIHTLCGGRAHCGCCRVHVRAGAKAMSPPNALERIRLGQDDLKAGWRLACQAHILRDIVIFLPTSADLEAGCSTRSE